MRTNRTRYGLGLAVLFLMGWAVGGAVEGAQKGTPHPMTHEDMIKMKRVGKPILSPDGRALLFTVSEYGYDKDKPETHVWMVETAGGAPRQVTFGKTSESAPAWSPDGTRLAFASDRGDASQIYVLDIKNGGEARPITKIPTGAYGPKWSPSGDLILFSSPVFPDCDTMDCQEKKLKEWKERKVTARAYDDLPIRFWDKWRDPQRNQLFVAPAAGGEAKNLFARQELESPTWPQGGPEEYDWSPDGKEIAFISSVKKDQGDDLAIANDVFTVPVSGGAATALAQTARRSETHPRYSRDGRWLAWTQTDLDTAYSPTRIVLYERSSKSKRVLDLGEQSAGSLTWSPDSKKLYVSSEEAGRRKIWSVALDVAAPVLVAGDATYGEPVISPDGATLYTLKQTTAFPEEIVAVGLKGSTTARRLTDFNRAARESIRWSETTHINYPCSAGAQCHALMLTPPEFDPSKKYPLLLLVHGGPYGAWTDEFHYRWNFQLFASPGYVVLAPNPHGSTGFGEKFAAENAADWGGKAFRDLMAGVDYALKTYPFIDGEGMVAAGGSYGGYMMNWFLGQTNRFKALVSHAGVFNTVSMYGTTEIPFFMERNFSGLPWTAADVYGRFNPQAYAARFKTPTLVTHGELDYRVPVSQGFELFTTLQRLKVPSRLVYFPDENHWILKPRNNKLWYEEVFAWYDRWLGRGERAKP